MRTVSIRSYAMRPSRAELVEIIGLGADRFNSLVCDEALASRRVSDRPRMVMVFQFARMR